MPRINKIALTLLEATITLYPAAADGAPLLDAPIWLGEAVENLRVNERWIVATRRNTGARYPRRHPLIPEYEISLDRPWALPLSQLAGFQAGYTRYVLDVVWTEEDDRQWHRRVFYGVTINEHALESREIDTGHTERQVFSAEYFSPETSGDALTAPPPIDSDLPYVVRYVGVDGAAVDLYSYDAVTEAFTLVGDTTGRATLGYNPDQATGVFEIKFGADEAPIVTVEATGVQEVALLEGMPTELPRLDFCRGNVRLASVTRNGIVCAPQFTEDTIPAETEGRFNLYAANVRRASVAAAGITAGAFTDFTPLQLNLLAWLPAERVGLADGVAMTEWLDESSAENDFTATASTGMGYTWPRYLASLEGRPAVEVRFVPALLLSPADLVATDEATLIIVARNVTGLANQFLAGSDPLEAEVLKIFAPADTAWHLLDQEVSAAGNFKKLRTDGGLSSSAAFAALGWSSSIQLGYTSTGTGSNTPRQYRCALVVNGGITAAQRTRLNGFLRDAYLLPP